MMHTIAKNTRVVPLIPKLTPLVPLLALLISPVSFAQFNVIEPYQIRAMTAPSTSWPTLGGNVARTGYGVGSSLLEPKLLWTFKTESEMAASPIVYEGIIYVGAENGYFYAVNQSSGDLIWREGIGGIGFSTPAAENGAIFAWTSGGYLYRLNASNGQVNWRKYIGHVDSSLLVAEGRVYLAGDYGYPTPNRAVFALSMENGSVEWEFNVSFPTEMAYKGGILYFGSTIYDDHIYALNATTGIPVWSFQADTVLGGGIAIDRGMIFASTSPSGPGGGTYALNATTGELIWRTDTFAMLGPPAITYGSVFASNTGALVALNETNGSRQWGQIIYANAFLFPTGIEILVASPVVMGGLVFADAGLSFSNYHINAYLLAYNATTGGIAWTFPVDGVIRAPPAVASSALYFTTNNGTLYALGNQAFTATHLFDLSQLALIGLFGIGVACTLVGTRLRLKSIQQGRQNQKADSPTD